MLIQILFYLFSAIIIFSAVFAIFSKTTINAVLLLVLIFFNSAAIFILLGAEFISIILILVYVGAIAVLFLFVVMMLDNEIQQSLKNKCTKHYFLYSMFAILIFAEMISIIYVSLIDHRFLESIPYESILKDENNTLEIGKILYTDYIFVFQILGLILFIAMIGSISLTITKKRKFLKHQDISKQIARNKENSISIV